MLKLKDNGIDLKKTFECGQCFRFEKSGDGSYDGIFGGNLLSVFQKDGYLYFRGDQAVLCEKDLCRFFDLETDYEKITSELSCNDEVLRKAAAFGKGIRILKQDLFETILSFIISQNNNIPRIKKIISSLCMHFGQKITADGREFYTFPTPEQLKGVTAEDLAVIRAGFRAKYIADAVEKINSGEVCLESIKTMSYDDAKAELLKIKGVGNKVADCILLFGAGKYDAFPRDVWVKRVMKVLYNDENAVIEGEYAGIAQQYLFYYARETKLKEEGETPLDSCQ